MDGANNPLIFRLPDAAGLAALVEVGCSAGKKHMTRTTEPRQISSAETAVIRAALERAPTASPLVRLAQPLEKIRVVGRCECGCDSVDFIPVESEVHSRPLADGIGTTPAGGEVGIIVWGTDDAVTGLEIYDLGAGDGNVRLPVVESIRPFQSEAD